MREKRSGCSQIKERSHEIIYKSNRRNVMELQQTNGSMTSTTETKNSPTGNIVKNILEVLVTDGNHDTIYESNERHAGEFQNTDCTHIK